MAPAATITSRLACAVYRAEPPLAGPNSTPDAVIGMLVLAQLIFVTWIGILKIIHQTDNPKVTNQMCSERQPVCPDAFYGSKVGHGS